MNRSLSPRHPFAPARVAWRALVPALAILACGCEGKPARLELNPPEVMRFYKKGQASSIQGWA